MQAAKWPFFIIWNRRWYCQLHVNITVDERAVMFFFPFFLFCLNRALQFPPEGWLRMSLNNGSITHLVIRPNGRVALRTLGDTGFMPPDKITRTWMSETAGYPGAASRLFALEHSAAVPLGFYLLRCDAVLKCPLAPCLLHTYSYLPFSPEKKKSF